MSSTSERPTAALRWYLAGTGLFLMPGGIQIVLLPWFVAVWLGESPARVGLAQMAAQLPMLLLIVGGVLGDRLDQRRLLVALHLLMALPPLLMLGLIHIGTVSFVTVLLWALAGALFAALAQPARDALLSRVAGDHVQRGVVLAIGVQLGVQIVGFALGASADLLGVSWLLAIQLASVLTGAWATARINVPAIRREPRTGRVHQEIGQALGMAWRDRSLRAALLLTLAVGVFFAGTFMVALPLMVRDLYAGGAAGMAGAFAVTLSGAVVTMGVLFRTGELAAPGRALTAGAVGSAAVLLLLALPLPAWGFHAVLFAWGMTGGVCVTLSRTIVQVSAPESHRARLMSVYMLALLGGMPIGSLLLGVSVELLGPNVAVLVPVSGMLVAVAALLLTTPLWRLERL